MLRAWELQLLKPTHLDPVLSPREAITMRSSCTATKSSPYSPQLEKAHAEQQRPNTAKRNKNLRKKKKKQEGESLQVGLCKRRPGQRTRILLPVAGRTPYTGESRGKSITQELANTLTNWPCLHPSVFHFRSYCISGAVMCDTKINSIPHLPFLLQLGPSSPIPACLPSHLG